MIVIRVTPEYTLNIPDRYRQMIHAGQEVALSVDAQGRLVITPVEKIQATLLESFGMWKDRTDLPRNGIEYMDQIRHGERLNQLI